MARLFDGVQANICWICREPGANSKEHKVKASDIKRQFRGAGMFVAAEGERGRPAQGPGSKHLKFQVPICHTCNTTRTQSADRAYDRVVRAVEQTTINQSEIDAAVQACLRQGDGGAFRYFGKLLGCQIADAGHPIPRRLGRFVAGEVRNAPLHLWARPDATYAEMTSERGGDIQYAAHGGLVIITKKPKFLPVGYASTTTIGPIQFHYRYSFGIFEKVAIRSCRDFTAECARAVVETPMTALDHRKYGYTLSPE
ncbi:hypothetical protein GCM10007859_26760 [Brevundimonas denitrificans]|uniref:HNH endonuclease n=1 Tax=Brevundimonas denitrificans TaxID=1443434 RepID=A0ABQ6BQZ0_9CAUL|nr:hypothetical protein [Brevundimonas denitrificans]GLS02647.1 hypothetical protein GCM10007859_26760 [Brevundimonas denitrificans]